MHLYFTATAFILLFFKCALGAPTTGHPKDACNRLKNSSLGLNKAARIASLEINGSKDPVDSYPILKPFEWIEAKDKCDPGNLTKDTEQTCIKKLFALLMSYTSAVETISASQRCPKLDIVKPHLQQLHVDMKECDKTRRVIEATPVSRSQPAPSQQELWQEEVMCRYTADRLFSFSIMVARVFAVGDPANHAQGSAEKCSQN